MDESIVWVLVLILNTVCAIAGAIFAANRRMHPGYGVLLGAFLGLLGLAILLCLPVRSGSPTTPLELADISVNCDCGHTIVAPGSQMGMRVKCPRCREPVQLPTSGAAR